MSLEFGVSRYDSCSTFRELGDGVLMTPKNRMPPIDQPRRTVRSASSWALISRSLRYSAKYPYLSKETFQMIRVASSHSFQGNSDFFRCRHVAHLRASPSCLVNNAA